MTRRLYIFDQPDRFVAGTVGQPGSRTFFLQAKRGRQLVSVVLEKIQVAALAERLTVVLDEMARRGVPLPARPVPDDDAGPLDEPLREEFRVGTLTISWDGEDPKIVVEAIATVDDAEDAPDPTILADDDPTGPDLLRVRLTASEARAFTAQAERLIAAGRPPCPLCGLPLNPEGHICPRRNGFIH